MEKITTRMLLENGVHLGHLTQNWNPKNERFIIGKRGGIYIIDLFQTVEQINRVHEYVKNLVLGGGTILFVGTKKQAKDTIEELALSVNMPYMCESWLGGTLTNFSTISKSIKRMIDLEKMNLEASAEIDTQVVQGGTKKERLLLSRELAKLKKTMRGIRNMTKLPDAIWVVDTNKEAIAVDEARKLGITVIASLDTNANPSLADFVIPGNDNSIASVRLLTSVIANAVKAGQSEIQAREMRVIEQAALEQDNAQKLKSIVENEPVKE